MGVCAVMVLGAWLPQGVVLLPSFLSLKLFSLLNFDSGGLDLFGCLALVVVVVVVVIVDKTVTNYPKNTMLNSHKK